MNLWVGITDGAWFEQLRAMSLRQEMDEVNFWRPSGASFKALDEGGLFLFKLHAPHNFLVGGGFFSRAPLLSVRLAWDAFGLYNGVVSCEAFRERIVKYNGSEPAQGVTCIILSEPFFFAPEDFIPVPPEFSRHIQVGRSFDAFSGVGRNLYEQVGARIARMRVQARGPAQFAVAEARFGTPRLTSPRLGQGGFRIGVLENYRRRCAISGERTVPVLEAAHIKRHSDGGGHQLNNGLLLRSDLHRLYDLGYLAIHPDDRRVLVSPRIREEYENGREYYALHGRRLAAPLEPGAVPDPLHLQHHLENVFRA